MASVEWRRGEEASHSVTSRKGSQQRDGGMEEEQSGRWESSSREAAAERQRTSYEVVAAPSWAEVEVEWPPRMLRRSDPLPLPLYYTVMIRQMRTIGPLCIPVFLWFFS